MTPHHGPNHGDNHGDSAAGPGPTSRFDQAPAADHAAEIPWPTVEERKFPWTELVLLSASLAVCFYASKLMTRAAELLESMP